jgi:Lipocalin-like domain
MQAIHIVRSVVSTVVALTLTWSSVASADDLASAIVGVWKVVSIETKEVKSGKVTRPLGDQLAGTFTFTRGGNFAGMVFRADRKAPLAANATEAERIALFNSLSPITGITESSATNW